MDDAILFHFIRNINSYRELFRLNHYNLQFVIYIAINVCMGNVTDDVFHRILLFYDEIFVFLR